MSGSEARLIVFLKRSIHATVTSSHERLPGATSTHFRAESMMSHLRERTKEHELLSSTISLHSSNFDSRLQVRLDAARLVQQ